MDKISLTISFCYMLWYFFLEITKEEINHLESIPKLFTSSMIDYFFPMGSGSDFIPTSYHEHFGYTYTTCSSTTTLRAGLEYWNAFYYILLRIAWDDFDAYSQKHGEIIGKSLVKQISTRFFRYEASNSVPRLRWFFFETCAHAHSPLKQR